ncbi:hypothetical protein Tco_1361394 [Tanacetum coccineum]
MLNVSSWKGVIRFGKRGKLSLRYIGPFKILARIGPVAYKLELPQELSRIHNAFYVSNLKKCLSGENLVIPLDEIKLDDKYIGILADGQNIHGKRRSNATKVSASLLGHIKLNHEEVIPLTG